jgi:very-short-patch-repair endonuclease
MLWFILVGLVLVIMILARVTQAKKPATRSLIKAKAILTMQEQPTFLRLKEALPEHFILAQVAFSAFMTARGYATRNLFNRKVADFVVLDSQFKLIAVVELDDASHRNQAARDASRDALLAEAGLSVIRYAQTPALSKIRADFAALGSAAPTAADKTELPSQPSAETLSGAKPSAQLQKPAEQLPTAASITKLPDR